MESEMMRRAGRVAGRMRAWLLPVGMALLCTACATPNLKPFADGAASFSSSIAQTNSDVEVKFGSAAENDARLKALGDTYRKSAKVYDDMAGLAAGYSSALAELGAAGETGGQAAEQMLQTIRGFAAFTDIPATGLPATLAGSVAGRAIQEAALAWTRVQAQGDLLATMKAADPAVQKLAQALVDVYGQPYQEHGVTKLRPFEKIVRDIVRQRRIDLKRAFGANRLSFYDMAGKATEDGAYAEAYLKLYDKDPAAASKAFDGVPDKLIAERARLQGEVSAYRKADQDLMAWQSRQLQASYLIADAAKAWAAEHQRLLVWFKNCGGTGVMKNACGQFSAASLNALASDIQYIVKGGNDVITR